MARIALSAVTPWITSAVHAHGERLSAHLAERLAIDRRSAQQLIASLVQAQWLVRSGSPRRPRYRAGTLRQVVQRCALAEIDSEAFWDSAFAPYFQFTPNVARFVRHAFAELLDNAVRHSGGSSVTVSLCQTATQVQLLVSDDGRGVFERSIEAADALPELERRLGFGLASSAGAADAFELHANGCAFRRRGGGRWAPARALAHPGTTVYVALAA